MKSKSHIIISVILLSLAMVGLYWKFFALYFISADAPLMNSALRYMQSRVAESWVDFYRGNAMFKDGLSTSQSDLDTSIQKLDIAIEYYLSSLNVRETREARENLEAAQKEYKKLKEEQRVKERVEAEEKKEEKQEEKQPSGDNSSGSGVTEDTPSQSGDTPPEAPKKDGESTEGSEGSKGSDAPKESDSGENPSDTPQENSKKDGPKGYTNTGTFFEGFSGSTDGDGLSPEDEQKLKESLNGLKELQNQKGNFTRPKGIPNPSDGMGGLFQKYFGDSSLFGNERDNDPYDY